MTRTIEIKEWVYRALRTFLQAFLGYLLTFGVAALAGVDFKDRAALKIALIGLLIPALGAGISALMNLDKKTNDLSADTNANTSIENNTNQTDIFSSGSGTIPPTTGSAVQNDDIKTILLNQLQPIITEEINKIKAELEGGSGADETKKSDNVEPVPQPKNEFIGSASNTPADN